MMFVVMLQAGLTHHLADASPVLFGIHQPAGHRRG
jgi:hypothetical protein